MLITGGSGSGKSWIAEGFQNEINEEESVVVLDCVAQLLGAKMEQNMTEAVVEEVIDDIFRLQEQTDHLIIATNEVFSDVPKKGKQQKFAEYLGRINQILAGECELFIEVVYGIPICRKNRK